MHAEKMGKKLSERVLLRCKQHTEHLHSTGVCPYCLREKLSYLVLASSSSSVNVRYCSSDSSSSACSTAYSSDDDEEEDGEEEEDDSEDEISSYADSPDARHRVTNAKKSSLFRLSRSFVVVGGSGHSQKLQRSELQEKKNNSKKKQHNNKGSSKFWYRLIMGGLRKKNSNKEDEKQDRSNPSILFHSKTMREKSSSKWVYY